MPTAANDNRPASFDALLEQNLYRLPSLARRHHRDKDKQLDLVQATCARALEKWRNYRDAGSFSGWLSYLMLQVVSNERDKKTPVMVSDEVLFLHGVEPRQEQICDAKAAFEMAQASPLLTRLALGETTFEIAAEQGVHRNAVRQQAARHRKKYLGMAAA